MSASRYYDMDGNLIDLWEFCRLCETDEARRVAWERRDDVCVSTVLLGLNHNWGYGPPLIFETMVFGGPHADEQWRYSTRQEAEEGHRQACELVFGTVVSK